MDKWERIKELARNNEQPIVLGGGMAHCAISADGVAPTLVTFIGGQLLTVTYEQRTDNSNRWNAETPISKE